MVRVRPAGAKLLRSEARRELLDCIISGRLSPGERIKSATLASQLGVSRTPLREALLGLELQGYVYRNGLRSFYVQPLDARDVEQICSILGSLEALAVRCLGLPKPETLLEMGQLTEGLSRTTEGRESMRLDDAWHSLVLEGCTNLLLLQSIGDLKTKLRRYDIAYSRSLDRPPPTAVPSKIGFLYACKMGNLVDAARWLEDIWLARIKPAVDWLEQDDG